MAVTSLAANEREAPAPKVDPTTLSRKVMCGYQGWFRCQGDGTDEGWKHWSRDRRSIAPKTLTVEMWPELSKYGDDEKFVAGDFTYADGKPAHLFSSAHPKTVERHFEWMREYGIDGVFLQRFLVEADRPSSGLVLDNVRAAAEKTGRVYALCYDLSGQRRETLVETLAADWKKLVDEQKITKDARYLHHRGKPVLFVWGFYPERFDGRVANRIIDVFQQDDAYSVTLIGGCDWRWRSEQDAEWAKAFRRFDVISPWNVGNVTIVDGRKQAATGSWKDDLAETRRAGKDFLPVVYPGFGWTNLKGAGSENANIPRLGGEFFWRQFATASELGIDMAYVAMFDEVDEATAIFKVTNDPPPQARFQTYGGLPSDWYLRLTGEGTKVIRGEQKAGRELPIKR